MEGTQRSLVPSKFETQQNKFHWVPRPANDPLWLAPLPSGPMEAPLALASGLASLASAFVSRALLLESFLLYLEG